MATAIIGNRQIAATSTATADSPSGAWRARFFNAGVYAV
jgi:hypothetical protein